MTLRSLPGALRLLNNDLERLPLKRRGRCNDVDGSDSRLEVLFAPALARMLIKSGASASTLITEMPRATGDG